MKNLPAIFVALCLLAGCAGEQADCARGSPPVSEEQQRRQLLNDGYSMLRYDARTISSVKWLLLVKVESDEFDQLVTAVSDFGSQLKTDLDRIAREYPAVRTDLDPLPDLERRKRLATGWDKFKDLAPLTGKSGMAFERTLLISLSNGVNQERHLVEEMAKEETDPNLKKFLQETQTNMDRIYERANALLEKKYYAQEQEG